MLSVRGVSINPGAIQLTLISPLKYLANDFVNEIIPAFVVEYITPYGSPIIPSTEDIDTILPFLEVSFIKFPKIFKHLYVPFKLTSIVLSII